MEAKRAILIFVGVFVALLLFFGIQQCTAEPVDTENAALVEEVVTPEETATEFKYQAVDNGEIAKTFDFETDYLKVSFDTKGASVSSIVLKNEKGNSGEIVDIIFKGNDDNNAFLMYWGSNFKSPVEDVFAYSISGNKVIFTKSFIDQNGKEFKVVKTFEFRDGEYLFAVNVKIEGKDIAMGDYAYSLAYEPQVGPSFTTMKNNNYDYRRFYAGQVKKNGKIKRVSISLNRNSFDSSLARTSGFKCNWISLTSKYFTVVARPENEKLDFKYSALRKSDTSLSQADGIYISVPSDDSENQTIYFYCGPQLKKYMGSYYNRDDNAWGISNYNLEDAMESSSFLGWLETGLKWVLQLLHKVIPNYGLCIIVLTILLKLALWPLQKRGSESTAKMSALNPQIQAIQAKYPDNTQKQNAAMQQLYKENDIHPMGGCLPLLIQFPILIAFYGLLNRHYELRGAMFIPGWIPDLSVPESIVTFGFKIPLLGNELHLLPIIYTASMIFSMKFTQASTQNNQQKSMWFMTWGMPIMFFFILYSAPSGLLLYWTCQNALAILQQVWTNRKMKNGQLTLGPAEKKEEKKEPEAVRKYQEKLRKAQEESEKNKKKGK